MKKLLLFTESYPLGGITEEAFVLPELAALARSFDRVYLIPVKRSGASCESWRVAPNIELIETYADARITEISKAGLLWRPWLWCAAIRCREDARRRMEYERFVRWADRFFEEEKLDYGNVILYTFWLAHDAEYVGQYVAKRGIRAISRAHRFDIFDMSDTVFRRKALQGLAAVYPCSQDGVREVLARYPGLEGRVRVSYLGVGKPNESALNPVSGDPQTITFFSCHSLIPRKRGLLSAKLLIQLAKTMPEKTVRWILVGDGVEKVPIQTLAADAPMNFILDMRGALPNAAVHQIYENEPIDIAVLLSESEGLAVMDQEALSYGIPAIGTDVGGTRECVSSKTGALLPSNVTFEVFRASVLRILADREGYSKEACKKYRQMFNVSRTRKEFAECLMEGK